MDDTFTTDVYEKAREVLARKEYDDTWQSYLERVVRPSELMTPDGPAAIAADGLENLRIQLGIGTPTTGASRDSPAAGAVQLPPIPRTQAARSILSAAKPEGSEKKWAERAAALKMLKHFYRHRKRGGQDVWIYSPPKAYKRWIFRELQADDPMTPARLDKDDEVYSETDKDLMCESLQFALMCSQKTEVLLTQAKPETMAIMQRWFGTTGSQVQADVARLLAGFKKITNLCNSNTLVFPDYPRLRAFSSNFNENYASVAPGGEGPFPVIYIAGAFLRAGSSGDRWQCALTIIHESSHLAVRTKDRKYSLSGLRIRPEFTHDDAMENADSWAFFCIDACGFLTATDRLAALG